MIVLFNATTCFSMLLSDVSSSCSSGRDSYGVSPSSPRTLSTSVAAPTNFSISANVLTTQSFRISGLNLARNVLFCFTSYILPFRNNLSKRSKYFWTLSLGSCLMVSIFIRISSASMFPYFCTISVRNSVQSAGTGYSLLNHSLVRPRKFSLAILNSLSTMRSRTSAAMVSRFAQSFTFSWSHPQNNSSIPWGLVIFTEVQQYSKMQDFSTHNSSIQNRCKQNWLETQLLQHSSDSWKTNVVQIIHQTRTEHPWLSVLEAQYWMEQWWSSAHP